MINVRKSLVCALLMLYAIYMEKIPAQTLDNAVFAFTFPLNDGNSFGMYEVYTISTILYPVSGYNFS